MILTPPALSWKPISPVGLHHRLRGISRQIFLACETISDLPALTGMFPTFTRQQIEKFLDALVAKRLVFREKDRFLALAVRQKT